MLFYLKFLPMGVNKNLSYRTHFTEFKKMLPSAIYSCTTFCAVLILMYISQKHLINQLSGLAKECPP